MQTDDRQVGRRVRNELLCLAQIELAVAAFDRICSLPDRYLVLPEHEVLEIERVVERKAAYVVVEKLQAA